MKNDNLKFKIFFTAIMLSFFGLPKNSQAVYPVAGRKRFFTPGFLFAIFLFLSSLTFVAPAYGANIYVDQTLSADCTSGNYSTAGRNCSGTAGNAYTTIQQAVNAMIGGDHIFIRGGTYTPGEQIVIPTVTKNGTSENYSSMESYPGEWAIIDGTGASGDYLIGNTMNMSGNADSSIPSYAVSYWRFERLEIRNYPTNGIGLTLGPIIVRYCYIHTPNAGTNTGAGFQGAVAVSISMGSVIEYNLFDDNGNTILGDVHGANVVFLSDYISTSGGFNFDTNYWHPIHHESSNIVRYNYMPGTTDREAYSIYQKAQQFLSPKTTVDFTRGTLGDKIHHNIMLGHGMYSEQDFTQIYQNIVSGGGLGFSLHGGRGYDTPQTGVCIYNNTIINNRIGGTYAFNATTRPSPYWYGVNNLFDGPYAAGDYDDKASINICASNPNSYDYTKLVLNRNYLYRANATNDINFWSGGVNTLMGISSYNGSATYSAQNYINYKKASSEGVGNHGSLYISTYVTDPLHVVSGSITIADGGENVTPNNDHPYLPGVKIPTYIGATNPIDNDWVTGVLSLGTLSSDVPTTLVNSTAGNDPDWIEDAEPSDDTTPPSTPSGLSVS